MALLLLDEEPMKRVAWLGCLVVPVVSLIACGGGLASPIDGDGGASSSSSSSSSGAARQGCLSDGVLVPVGTSVSDGCNSCFCQANGDSEPIMACTAVYCSGETDPPPPQDGGPPLPDPDAGATRLSVDGTSCIIHSEKVEPHTAPDGKTWSLSVKATCPSGAVDIFASSREAPPYPHLCNTSSAQWTVVQMIGPTVAPDGGRQWFSTDTGGSCNASQGPTVANGNIPVAFSAVVVGFLNETHTLSYAGQ